VFNEVIDTASETQDIEEVIIDLAGVDYLDSSALGMLLIFRDKGGEQQQAVGPCQSQWHGQTGI